MTKSRNNPQETQPNTSNSPRFSTDQWRYIATRISNPEMSKRAAAEHVNIPPDTAYKWKDVDAFIDANVESMANAAISAFEQMLMEAVMVKMAGLRSGDESVQQKTATEIIDRVLGKPSQHTSTDLTSGGEKLQPSVTVNAYDAGNILDDLKRLGAIEPNGSATDNDAED